ncbi:superfamily II DNA or RNA helicase [Mucilaginibacter sp. SG538B]|uniref:SNF2-related protein n=1 Tax=Mucilaginibacter sp. SG538B TaxID=2587021 RepID=UPI00159D2D13|nr:SNF2-related protein [Mucilaginibacter sp. SG538B]NVM64474.1 superfamily II DNA or RNA helicase [Mucilaginibacter sp. SG538B]
MDFDNPPPPLVVWPDNHAFPLNLKDFVDRRTVLEVVMEDIAESENYLVVTGFTSLAHIIELFGGKVVFGHLKDVRIVLGFEPELRERKLWKSAELDKDVREYWAGQHYSLLNGGVVIKVIELIKGGRICFRLSDGLHAKIYVGDKHTILGSANFSKNGLTLQHEANIRIANDLSQPGEHKQYQEIKQIAENYYQLGKPYNDTIIELLKNLLKLVTWQEALARAISELVDKPWLNDIPELYNKLNSLKLWPSQRLGLGQAMYILQTQGCVLIADPTGSGKTKMISTLQLVLYHWLWETGRRNRSYAVTICPPLVKDSWHKEFVDIEFSQSGQISMGALSYTKGHSHGTYVKEIRNANILVVDEAHNFLNLHSFRSMSVAEHTSDNIILATATPINKRPKDLMRLIELLGVDNLGDQELEDFKKLKRQRHIKSNSPEFAALKTYIEKFIVRRTKTQLNKLIDREPELYINRQGKQCRYPENSPKIYKTGETKEDQRIAQEINRLAGELKGLIYLQSVMKPDDLEVKDEQYHIDLRLRAAKALSKYNIQAKMRSSKAALLEHLKGTDAALEEYKFKSGKDKSGNVISTINKLSTALPKNQLKSVCPEWLTDLTAYQQACREEINIYEQIAKLSIELSLSRELRKISELLKLFNEHALVLAFDSTVLTLDFLGKLIRTYHPDNGIEHYVVTGASTKTAIASILKKFDLGSTSQNVLALCSDSMSEGVNLQQASALMFLDMPSVLRIAEQRIGRIDRLDSPHSKVKVYWPMDSVEFALRSDERLIKTSFDTESLIGSNFTIPDEIMGQHLDHVIKPEEMIKAIKENKDQEYLWAGVKDAFTSVHDLYEGEDTLIDLKTYEAWKDVDASVKVKLSIGHSERPWIFLAVKGIKAISPRWYFVDAEKKISVELGEVCQQLRQHISGTKHWEMKWSEPVQKELDHYIKLLLDNEINILPSKRKRAIEVAKFILEKQFKLAEKDLPRRKLIRQVLEMFEPRIVNEEYNIDYYHFSQQWLDIFTPILAEKKRAQKKKDKKVLSLLDLRKDKSVALTDELLQKILNDAPLIVNMWSRVASCIIGLPDLSN